MSRFSYSLVTGGVAVGAGILWYVIARALPTSDSRVAELTAFRGVIAPTNGGVTFGLGGAL